MTRTLGPEGYGVIGFYESLMSVVVVVAAFGVQYFGLRRLSKFAIGDIKQDNTVLHLILINLLISVLGAVFYLIYVFTKATPIGSTSISLLYGFVMLIYMLHLDWYFQSQEKFQLLLLRTLIARVLVLISAVLFVRKPEDLIYYLIISALNYSFISGVALYSIRGLFKQWKWDFNLFKKLLKALWPFAILGILGAVYIALDTILLARLGRLEELGYYTVAAKIVRIGLNVFIGASIVFFVKLFRSSINKTLQSDSLLMTIHLSFPIAGILYFFAEPVLFFVSGNEFMPSVGLLQIFAFLWIVVPFHDFFTLQVLMVHHKEKWVLQIFGMATLLSLGLNLILIPVWYATGAAWSIVFTETMVLIAGIYYSRNYFTINRKQWMEISSVVLVFPIAFLAYSISNKFIGNNLLKLISGSCITLLIHIPVQLFLFKSRFWILLWESTIKKRNS